MPAGRGRKGDPYFTAYDVRGRLGVDLDTGSAYRVGRGFAQALKARRVVLKRFGFLLKYRTSLTRCFAAFSNRKSLSTFSENALGRDCRQTSQNLVQAVVQALLHEGVEVLDLGLCGICA
jgi:phosphomannomutase